MRFSSVRKSTARDICSCRSHLSWTLRAPFALCIQFIIRLSANVACLKRTQSKCLPPRGNSMRNESITKRATWRSPSPSQWSFIEGAERIMITYDVFYDRLMPAIDHIFLCLIISEERFQAPYVSRRHYSTNGFRRSARRASCSAFVIISEFRVRARSGGETSTKVDERHFYIRNRGYLVASTSTL